MTLLAHPQIRWWLWRSLLVSCLLVSGFWLGAPSAGGSKTIKVNTGLAVSIAITPAHVPIPEVKTVIATKAVKKQSLPKPKTKVIKQSELVADAAKNQKPTEQSSKKPNAPVVIATKQPQDTVKAVQTRPNNDYVNISQPVFARTPTPPRYPTIARKRGQQGTVWLDVWLDKYGQQQKLAIATSSGLNSLDNSAFQAVSNWHFKAHLVNGIAMATRVRIPVQFSLN